MALDIEKHFTTQFEVELFEAFQNKGGVMRPRLRRKTATNSSEVKFPKIGLAPEALPKSRNGKVPLMEILRDRVTCGLADYYGADMIDDLDELKTNVEERGAVTRAIMMSLARTEDRIGATALTSGANANDNTASDDSWTSDAIPRLVLEAFGNAEAMDGDQMQALVSWKAWNALLAINSFINADYGGDTMMSVEGQRPKKYFGFNYAPWSLLPKHSSGAPWNLWWNPRCAGIGVGKDATSEITWLSDYDAWFIKGKMSLGSVLIEQNGVIKRRYAA